MNFNYYLLPKSEFIKGNNKTNYKHNKHTNNLNPYKIDVIQQ